MSTTSAPKAAHITGWDRAIVIALGGAGCALSYDALQQMAVAIHVRGFLTYLFPLVIDGFIAYGVRALLVLRDAPLRARLYLWVLFGTATAASIWANALHAVRLNDETVTGTGLRLGDTVVAVLSTIAPLALAGAVHLYILIARGAVKGGDRQGRGQVSVLGQVTHTGASGQQPPKAGQDCDGQPVTDLTERPSPTLGRQPTGPRSLTGDSASVGSETLAAGRPRQPHKVVDMPRQPVTPAATDPAVRTGAVTGHQDSRALVSGQGAPTGSARQPDPSTEELLEIARAAVRAQDKLTRKVVAQAIRGRQIPLSSDRLTVLMAQLREQYGQPVTTARD
ncbi:DUF2637 domain-containing protein [Streptomyces buecherae]|uniref:DUF2637 domain-containing protein n=1 Tax=Streptomyces buecherae TaxID=2763006 RepID=A0A7H8NGE7_9ACTN|nr:DUF2637 domain-containing protein [Streptomyces buecherae]QKW53577.1 DUF2637 domain-containing protein [Streptomyces buecherae]